MTQEKKMKMSDLNKHTKMAMVSQFLGFMLDAYDMALVLVMAPILTKLFAPPHGDPAWEYISIVFSLFNHDGRSTRGCCILGTLCGQDGETLSSCFYYRRRGAYVVCLCISAHAGLHWRLGRYDPFSENQVRHGSLLRRGIRCWPYLRY